MKKMNIYLLVFILWVSTLGCEGLFDCHLSYRFVNNSQDSVIMATVYHDGFGNCNLGYMYGVSAKGEVEPYNRTCIENILSTKDLELYIVDPVYFNNQQEFYSCDSIEIKNKVLKKYTISLGQLQSNNFKVTYP